MDANGAGALSLAEVEKAVGELWPQFDNKPALMRAYQAVDDGLVTPAEFGSVLTHILFFNALWPKLERVENSAVSRYRLQVRPRLLAACAARCEMLWLSLVPSAALTVRPFACSDVRVPGRLHYSRAAASDDEREAGGN